MSGQTTIAVIGAMEQEIELLKSRLQNCQEHSFGAFRVYEGSLHGKRVVLSLSGIGKVNAAVATTWVIQQFQADCVINTGSAGGLAKGLRVGDVVIGVQTAHHDVDATAFGYALGQVPQLPLWFTADARLVATAQQAAQVFTHATVHQGVIVSGDQFIHSSEKVAAIRAAFAGVQAVEMEAAAIAQVCTQLRCPFVIIRAISDLADEAAEMSFEAFLQQAAVHSAEMVDNMIAGL